MELDQIVERIEAGETLTIEELSTAQTELTTIQGNLAGEIKAFAGGDLAELVAKKTEYDAVTDALSKVVAALGDAQAQVQAIIDDVTGGEDAPTVAADAEPVVEAEVQPAAPVAASIRGAVARHRAAARTTDRPTNPERELSDVNTTFTLAGKDVDEVNPADIGKAFADTARRFNGTKTSVLSVRTELHPDRTLGADASVNERKLLDLFGANPVVPVTASGGCCSIPEPIYDQPMIGSLARPIRGAFDVLNASRGAVTNYPPICLPDEGADVWTCIQDAAVDPDDPDTWKSCTEVECDTPEPTLVEPIYKCLTIGTFQQKFAPEQWEATVFQTDKLAARLAEARLFDWLAQAATSVYDTPFTTGSTYANFIKTGIRLATAMRADQRLGDVSDAQMVWIGPDLIFPAIVEDTLTRRLNVAEEIEIVRDRVRRVLADEGITYVGSQDIANMTAFSYSGSVPAYPSELPTVMLPAGSAKVLDGGEKNLGVDFVDLDLARQNKVAAFSEFWEGLLVRNCNVVFATVPVEDCDLGCPPVAS